MQFKLGYAPHRPILPRLITKREKMEGFVLFFELLLCERPFKRLVLLSHPLSLSCPRPRPPPLAHTLSLFLSVMPALEASRWLRTCFDVDPSLPRRDLPWWVSSAGVRACVGERRMKGGRLGPRMRTDSCLFT